MKATMPCRWCGGSGRCALTPPYATTFVLVGLQWLDAKAILDRHKSGLNKTALLNRLNKLVRWGLVERVGSGRLVLWRKR